MFQSRPAGVVVSDIVVVSPTAGSTYSVFVHNVTLLHGRVCNFCNEQNQNVWPHEYFERLARYLNYMSSQEVHVKLASRVEHRLLKLTYTARSPYIRCDFVLCPHLPPFLLILLTLLLKPLFFRLCFGF